jgi:DNA-directed RNA polymerase subunit RPC12/RpoP
MQSPFIWPTTAEIAMTNQPPIIGGSVERDYPAAYSEYRKYFRLCYGTFLLGLPIMAVIGGSLSYAFDSSIPAFIVFVMISVPLLVGGQRLREWICPRCGRTFHVAEHIVNLAARKCANCGLSLTDQGRSSGAAE